MGTAAIRDSFAAARPQLAASTQAATALARTDPTQRDSDFSLESLHGSNPPTDVSPDASPGGPRPQTTPPKSPADSQKNGKPKGKGAPNDRQPPTPTAQPLPDASPEAAPAGLTMAQMARAVQIGTLRANRGSKIARLRSTIGKIGSGAMAPDHFQKLAEIRPPSVTLWSTFDHHR